MGRKVIDITNQNFGNLTALEIYSGDNNGVKWKCICNICGNYCYPYGHDLRRGRTNYCQQCNNIFHKTSPIKTLYGNYKRGAKKRCLEFDLSIQEFYILIKGSCYYCGTDPIQILKKENAKYGIEYNGIDRKNNNIGYTKENSIPCCKFCNFAKGKNTEEEFLEWVDRLIKFRMERARVQVI